MRQPSSAAASIRVRRSRESSARTSGSVRQTWVMASICEARSSGATCSSARDRRARRRTASPAGLSPRVSGSIIWYSSSTPRVYSSTGLPPSATIPGDLELSFGRTKGTTTWLASFRGAPERLREYHLREGKRRRSIPMLVKDELLDKVLARVREQLPEDQAPQVEEFARQYYAWIPVEDLEGRSPVDIYGAVVAHWNFARQRTPGSAKIRVYNPNFEEHGWQSTHTVLEIVTDDMPFLVDSTRMGVNRQGFAIHLMLHPIMRVKRDDEGRIVEVLDPDSADEEALSESVIHVEVDQQTEPNVLQELYDCIERVFEQVRAAVEDWPDMREQVHNIVSELEEEPPPVEEDDLAEAEAFLEWIVDDHFTFLGYREYELLTENGEDVLRSVPETGLGILRQTSAKPISHSFAKLPPEVRRLAHEPHLLNLTKANSRATIHRPSYMDYVGIKRFDSSGEVAGERRFIGLYTFSAYSSSALEIPIVRRKVRYVLDRAGFPAASHYEKDLIEILETYPRDELFQISNEELFEISMGILHLQERQRVRLFVRRDAYGRFFSCLVFVPRDRYNTQIRRRMQNILQRAFNCTNVEFNVRLSESVLARLHFIIYVTPGEVPDYDLDNIEERLVEATRSWTDNLYDALIEHFGEERGTELFRKYREAFPPGYRDGFLPRTAVA